MDFARDYLVHYYEADCNRLLTPQALIQYFEDISILHTSSLGYDLAFYEANNCGWMLLKWDIRINRLPSFGETVRVATKVNAMRRFLADRIYTLEDASGTVLVEARSIWLLADTVKRRPLRVPEEQFVKYGLPADSEKDFVMIDDVAPFAHPGRADEGDTRYHKRSVRTGRSDIDTNSHVNNVRYLAWALDSLPSEYGTDFVPASMRVHYKKELGLGDEADIMSFEDRHAGSPARTTRHTVVKGADEICSLEIGWKYRSL